MKRTRWVMFGIVLLLGTPAAGDETRGYVLDREIPLEGGTSFDLMTVDAGSARLYVAHSPAVDVVDLTTGKRVGTVPGGERMHGVAVLPAASRGFAASGTANKVFVFDLGTLKVTKEVETGENPDEVLAVGSTGEVWTFNGKAKSVTCLDAKTLEVTATIPLPGKPELAADHAEKGIVYVALEDKNEICAIDAKAHRVLATHPVAPGEEPAGLALDPKTGLLFVGCGNKKLVVLDSADWESLASFDIGEHCDGVVFDPGTGDVVASCRDSTGVFHEKDAKTVTALASLPTPGGKTCALDAKTHALYVASGPRRGETGVVKVLVFAFR